MEKTYRIPFFKTWPFVGILITAAMQVWALTIALSIFKTSRVGFYWLICFVGIMGLLQAVVIIGSRLTVEIAESHLTLRLPGEAHQLRWEDIKRIERIWTMEGGSFVYQIVTIDGRRLPPIPDFIESCEELLTALQERSGKRIVSETRTIGVSIKEDWQKLLRWFRPTKSKH